MYLDSLALTQIFINSRPTACYDAKFQAQTDISFKYVNLSVVLVSEELTCIGFGPEAGSLRPMELEVEM